MSAKEEKAGWSEWAWDEGRGQWWRSRKFNGKDEYQYEDPQPSTSSASNPAKNVNTDWSEWLWDGDRSQWWRSRILNGKEEYEYGDPQPSSSTPEEAKAKGQKGKGNEAKGREVEQKVAAKGNGKKKEKIELSVEIYRPMWGSLKHWALYLGPYRVYQVIGESMEFTADIVEGVIPSESGKWIASIHVCQIQPDDLDTLHSIITTTPVQNDCQGWCCQDYVLEALERLNVEQIVDDDDYKKVKKNLMKRFNE